jgi:hypothetical protein
MMDGMSFWQKYAELDAGGREGGQFCVRIGVIVWEAEFQERADGLFPFDFVLGLSIDLYDFGGLLSFRCSVKFNIDGQRAEIGNGCERIVIRMEAIGREHAGNGKKSDDLFHHDESPMGYVVANGYLA